MTVYVLIYCTNKEPEKWIVKGVYTTRGKAKRALDRVEEKMYLEEYVWDWKILRKVVK